MDQTPVSLLARVSRQTSPDDWARFVDLFAPLLDGWAHALGLQDADAADLVQDVFVTLVRRLPDFEYDPRQSFRAWLWTVLHNAWRDRLRRRTANLVAPEDLDRLAEPDGLPAFVEADYRRYIVGRAVQVMRADFEPATWRAFWEQVVEGRTGADVAERVGLSVNAVYLARVRVLSRLRQELAGLYP
jgi:RNA polymerase sigma-70 factor (ECF subfamily)